MNEEERKKLAERGAEAKRRLGRVIRRAVSRQGAFGGCTLHTTGIPFYDDKKIKDVSAVSVSGADLTYAFGVQIVRVDCHGDCDEKELDVRTLGLYDREELVFVRDALTRLIEAGVFADEDRGASETEKKPVPEADKTEPDSPEKT